MTDMTPMPSQGKTFWQRPEGTFAKVVGVVVGGVLVFKYGLSVLTFFNNVIWTTVNIVIGGAILAAVVYMIWDGRLLRAASYIYKSFMRWVFNWITSNDPIGVMKTALEKMGKILSQTEGQMGTVRGVMVQLRTAIANSERNRTNALRLADQAGKENNALQVRVKSKTASIYGKSTMTYQELLTKLEVMYRVLNKYHDIAKSNIEVMTVELQESTMRHSAARAVGAAMKGFWSIMATGEDKEMYDLAKEHIAEEWDNTVGEMENFLAISKDVVSSFDLEQGVLEEDGLKQLSEWEQKADSMVLGAEKPALIAAANDPANLLHLPGSEDYEKLFKNQ